MVKVGLKKMIFEIKDPSLYVLVVSARMNEDVFEKKLFYPNESMCILQWAIQLQSVMKMPDIQYLMLTNFEEVVKTDFFKSQALLKGMSICDICLIDQNLIREAL